ncbi:carboxymethylenebutenolidase [Alphaproteobacteria bacterium 46_93_T64]|nr:carboxymethylenebutenolidase [Alphaproteobacteria bacterium 46_93_T64]
MGERINLVSDDSHNFNAYVSRPNGDTKGAIIVVQEIFGVNSHIRAVCDQYADLGYTAIVPALFDRISEGIELQYDTDGVQEGLKLKGQVEDAAALKDIAAAVVHVASNGPVAIVGYCWGGTLAFLAACDLGGISKAIGYYGGGIAKQLGKRPQIPTLLHFGDSDGSIPMEDVDLVTKAHPELEIHVYEAGHGFNCDVRGSYDKASADLALDRTLKFLEGA